MLRKKSIIYNNQYSTNAAMVKIKKCLSKIKYTLILKMIEIIDSDQNIKQSVVTFYILTVL